MASSYEAGHRKRGQFQRDYVPPGVILLEVRTRAAARSNIHLPLWPKNLRHSGKAGIAGAPGRIVDHEAKGRPARPKPGWAQIPPARKREPLSSSRNLS